MFRTRQRLELVDEFHNQTPTNLPTISRSLDRVSVVLVRIRTNQPPYYLANVYYQAKTRIYFYKNGSVAANPYGEGTKSGDILRQARCL